MSMANPATNQKYLGVTPPISVAPPTERDLIMTRELEDFLRESGFFETEEEGIKREIVLGKLNAMVRDFVKEVGRRKHLPPELIEEVSGKIYTFGSYRLGVHSTGADIDTLCVAPQHVERGDFFGLFYAMLEANEEVTGLTAVPDAYVPVIKMKFDGISIDLLFARLNLISIPEELDLCDSSVLKNLDEKCILSLNGSRTTDEMLKLVPNTETFHIALRCMKLWAKRRGIYSNAMGYVAGVALALLTARICQLYPNASGSTIVTRFFKIYQQWQWPQPVYLKPLEDLPLQMKVWNPRIHPTDRYHKMPVITPAYPSMCATHNVTSSTLRMMTEEFQRGSEIMLKIERGKATWADLLAHTDFFARYRNFFQVVAVSRTEEEHLIWSGFLGSKIRYLTPKLEIEEHIEAAPPFHEGFDLIVNGESLDDVRRAHWHDPNIPSASSKPEEVLEEGEESTRKKFYTTAFYVALVIAPLDPDRKGMPRRICLDTPVNDFKTFVSAWEKITPDMHIIIRDVKRDNLPDYCFENVPRPPKARKSVPALRPGMTIPVAGGASVPLTVAGAAVGDSSMAPASASPKRTRTSIDERMALSLDSSLSNSSMPLVPLDEQQHQH